MAQDAKVIGSVVSISIPAGGVSGLAAKVDTGADGSSIWATKISEDNGTLTFRLLGPSSPQYTGEIIKSKDYSRVIVKNSFGASESRYQVALAVEVEGRKVKARFTLANRKLKSYSALIGRRLLNNRFIVDVSKPTKVR
jgi:hypothetical protein